MYENNNFRKPKLTIVDAELRDLFTAFVSTGLVLGYDDLDDLLEDKEQIAAVAYEISDALIRRRKANKQKHAEENRNAD